MKQPILKAILKSVKGLYDANLVNAKTMHTFDAMCLPPVRDLKPIEVKDPGFH